MNVTTYGGTPPPPNQGPGMGFAPVTRHEKTVDFMSSALPAALISGAQGFSASGAAASASAASSGTSYAAAAGSVGSAASIAGGIYGAIQLGLNWGKSTPATGASSGMAVGATIGTMIFPGMGTAVGAAIGAIAGGLIGAITAGKHKDQKVRDSVRDMLQQAGVINGEYQIRLADGSSYDIGKDGGPRDEFGGRRPYEIDYKNPMTAQTIAWIDPIVALFSQGNTKVHTDFVGYFTNAALSNAKDLSDVRNNVNAIVSQFGISNEQLVNAIASMGQSGQLDKKTAQDWINGVVQRVDPRFQATTPSTPNTPL